MTLINPATIIYGPVITERSLLDQTKGKYTLWVNQNSNKNQIAVAFTQLFGAKALKVNVVKSGPKTKTDWRTRQKVVKIGRKKAIVTVSSDTKIESLTLNTK
jgi:ribosomal protein L23